MLSVIVMRCAKSIDSGRSNIASQEQRRPGSNVREPVAPEDMVKGHERTAGSFKKSSVRGTIFNLGVALLSPVVVIPQSYFYSCRDGQAKESQAGIFNYR